MRLALGLCALLISLGAHAQVAPYADWRFQLERAGKDPAKIRAVAEKSPAFTRAWFYGHVFDLSIAGIAAKEKARIRAKAAIFAEVLAQGDPPDLRPSLLLEVPVETLRADFDAMQAVLNAALNDDRPVDRVARSMTEIPHALVAHAGFYTLLHRADVANPRLGGRYDAGRRLESARGLAEFLALADGDIAPWLALAAYRGTPLVQPDKPTIAEARVAEGLNLITGAEPAKGRAILAEGRRAIGDAGSPSLRLSAMGLGPALIAERTANHAGARGGLSAGSRGGPMWMQHVLKRRALSAAVRARDPRSAIGLAKEMLRFAETQRADPRDDAALIGAIELWRQVGEAHVAAGKLDKAAEMFDAAHAWTRWLRRSERLEKTVPAAKQQAAKETRSALAAEVGLAAGRLALRLGRDTAAAEAFRSSRGLFLDANRPARAAVAELALAEVLLISGDLDQSVARASDGITAVAPQPREAARGLAMRGLIRLRRAELAPAFANANAGLEVIKAARLEAPELRVRLHLLAAAALDADGQRDAARDRVTFARSVQDSPAVAIALATLLAEAGDLAGARAAVQAHAAQPEAAVVAGCLETRAGDFGPAAARLAPLLTGLGTDLDLQVQARACLAAAWNGLNQRRRAQALLMPPEQLRAADPAERWALLAAVSGSGGADVTVLRTAAVESWRRARGDGHLRTLLDRRPRAYADIGPVIDAWIAEDLARRDGDWAASLTQSIWWAATQRALRSAAPRPDADLPGEVLRRVRGPLLQAMAQRAVIADPAISDAQRAAATERRAKAWATAVSAADTALAAHPRWAAYAAPLPITAAMLKPPAGTTRLYFQTGAARSRAWLYAPTADAPTAANLPGRAALASLRAGVEGHLLSGSPQPESGPDPHRTAWQQLAQAAKTLIPMIVKRPDGVATPRLEVLGDGPMAFFPVGALVLDPPKRAGQIPSFAGARWAVIHRLNLRDVPDGAADAGLSVASGSPAPAGLETIAARLGARRGTVDRHSGLVVSRPLAHVHGRFGAESVAVGDARTTRRDVARLGAQPFELVVSGEIDDDPGLLASAWAHAGATGIMLPIGAGPATPDAFVVETWSRVIGKAPVAELVFSRTERGGALTPSHAPGTSATVRLRQAAADTRAAVVRRAPRPGVVPAHHPSQWARWLTIHP